MNTDKILYAAMDAFKQNFTAFCQNSDNLIDICNEENFKKITIGLIDATRAAGQAGLVEYLMQHDIVKPIIEKGGKHYRYKGISRNDILTLFGEISVERAMYYDEKTGGDYFFPLDHSIGLEKNDFATLETREMILYGSANCVPTELSRLLKKCSLCTPSATAIQNIINKDGQKMEELREELQVGVFEEHEMPLSTQAVVASLDGANLLLREPGEKKGRKNQRPGESSTAALSPTSYHNAMVGAISYYRLDTQTKKPERISSVYIARMPEEKSIAFKDDFERLLKISEQQIGDKPIHRILLTDGHLMIKGFAKKSKLLQPYEKLLDFFHTTEHLSKAADAMYGEKTDTSKWWYTKWREELKTGNNAPNSIVRSMESFASRHRLSDKRKKELKTEITFFRKNKHLMNYAEFLRRGLPIGSGPIEAAAKTIVKQRMCRSGMSWSREKGQYILTIKAYVQSGLWDDVWNNFKKLKRAA